MTSPTPLILKARERRKLQAMIDATARAANTFHRQQEALNEWSIERYGHEPGDIDADEIIDGVFGGCGVSSGMTADEFHEIMTGGGR